MLGGGKWSDTICGKANKFICVFKSGVESDDNAEDYTAAEENPENLPYASDVMKTAWKDGYTNPYIYEPEEGEPDPRLYMDQTDPQK